ncbi:glycosyltransferase [Patescibacteria group bacterium]|nr:glycosyltransferase [Patescibacteria group bacterium]
MKIVVFAEMFLPHVDGVTNSLVHLTREFTRQGHEVLVITPKAKGSNAVKLKGIKIIFLPSIPAVVYPEIMIGVFSRELFSVLRKFSPDIVHVIGPGTVGSMGLFYSKLVNIKSIAAFHGYFMEPEYLRVWGIKNRGVETAQKLLWKLAKTFYDRADAVITPSNFVKNDLLDHDFSSPINVIRNAVDFSNIGLDKEEQKAFIKKYSLSKSKVILYVGRVSLEKNIEILIKSFAIVATRVPDLKFLIVGGGPDLKRLQKLALDRGLENQVIFSGELKNLDLVKKGIFKLAKVFVTASHSEVQPVSIIEAMNFGLPIVAVHSRGLVEMIQENGCLVNGDDINEFSDKISAILLDEKLQKKMSRKSTQLVKEYSITNSAKQHLELYKKLIIQKKERKSVGKYLKSKIGR